MSHLTENALLLTLSLHRPGTRRSVNLSEINVTARNSYEDNPDPEMIHVSRDILVSEEFTQIVAFDRNLNKWLRQRALPFPLRAGTYLLPVASVLDVNTHLEESRALRHDDLIPRFLQAYPDRVEESKARLGALAKDVDYPPAEEIEEAFRFQSSWLALDVPKKLGQISATVFAREQHRAEQFWSDATSQIVGTLVTQFSEVVTTWEKRLSNPQPAAFKTDAVDKLEAFLQNLRQLNAPLANAPLDELITRAQSVISGVTVDALKDNKDARSRMLDNFSALKDQLAALVSAQPSRKLRLDLLREQPAAPATTPAS